MVVIMVGEASAEGGKDVCADVGDEEKKEQKHDCGEYFDDKIRAHRGIGEMS